MPTSPMPAITVLPASGPSQADRLHDRAHNAISRTMPPMGVLFACRRERCTASGQPYHNAEALADMRILITNLRDELTAALLEAEGATR